MVVTSEQRFSDSVSSTGTPYVPFHISEILSDSPISLESRVLPGPEFLNYRCTCPSPLFLAKLSKHEQSILANFVFPLTRAPFKLRDLYRETYQGISGFCYSDLLITSLRSSLNSNRRPKTKFPSSSQSPLASP